MKIKLWPIVAVALFLCAALVQKFVIARNDLKNAQANTQIQTIPQTTTVGLVHLYTPETARTLAQAQLDPVPATTTDTIITTPVTDTPDTSSENDVGWLAFLKANLLTIVTAVIALLEVIVRLTPTERDNSLLSAIKAIIDKFIPNRRTGGGVL
jgi:hypothetical protein